MGSLVAWFQDFLSILAPTTWLLLLGILVSLSFVKKALS